MSEEWRDIPGYEGYYQASDFGRIRSLERLVWNGRTSRINRGRLLKPSLSGGHGDYRYTVTLRKNGEQKTRKIHQLVLEAFVGPKRDGFETCHNDGNKLNNVLGNLRWGTHKENTEDMYVHGSTPRGEKNGSARLTEQGVLAIRGKFLSGLYTSKDLAAEYGVSATQIYLIASGKRWKHI